MNRKDFDDLIHEGEMLDVGIKIATYYDSESGDLNYAYDITTPLGTAAVSQIVGILEYVKYMMLTQAHELDEG